MTTTIGTRVTGYIANRAGRAEFTGTVTDAYRSGSQDAITVACDDGQERTALAANVSPEELAEGHVTSVRGGKTHLADSESHNPFPLCTSGARNTYTHYRRTTAPVDCKECAGILARRAARLASA